MNASRKSIKVGDQEVFDVSLIYSRVLGLQQSRKIDLKDVLKHELSPIPTSMFKETGVMRIAVGKISLKNKQKVTGPSCLTQDFDVVIMDGCANLWCVHWPCEGSVKDFIDNFCRFSNEQDQRCSCVSFVQPLLQFKYQEFHKVAAFEA